MTVSLVARAGERRSSFRQWQRANCFCLISFPRYFFSICLVFYFSFAVCLAQENSMAEFDPRWVQERHREQMDAAKSSRIFTGFRFTDGSAASGMHFEDIRVEEALKYFTPSHYD